jgi:hypothetical protein
MGGRRREAGEKHLPAPPWNPRSRCPLAYFKTQTQAKSVHGNRRHGEIKNKSKPMFQTEAESQIIYPIIKRGKCPLQN